MSLALLVLTFGGALPSSAFAGPPGTVIDRHQVPSTGRSVVLRSLYRSGRPPLPAGAIMSSAGLLSEANYTSVRNYAQSILERYPPDQYYYVGVGRTANTVISFLKNVSPHIASNFPSSAIQRGAAGYATHPQNYRDHIEALIPAGVRQGDRKILLIDHSSGGSLRGLAQVFEAYRNEGRAMPATEMVSLGAQPSAGIGHIQHDHEFWQNREAVAEFIGEMDDGGHVIHSAQGGLATLKRNPAHAEYRRKLFERMERDEALDQFLRTKFPTLIK